MQGGSNIKRKSLFILTLLTTNYHFFLGENINKGNINKGNINKSNQSIIFSLYF